ncbi:MAG: hypothetical protein Satyrvirus5_29 [Satyrvirus sp.]|uniref:FAD-binding PCMH-type domain-containing protein n=1 Tax=Satyrvirus sp. TaxID=2487771 RepID=A0A3G5AF00_9VIRU|nr:MAG: hypothetical protein Satyrvirus5_29 [Satyrvirus sp.]
MTRLDATVRELWMDKAAAIIKEKGLSSEELRQEFSRIYFPWDTTYNNYRFMYKLQIQELPLFVIVPCNKNEICKLLCLAYIKKLTMRIISGRHSSNIQNSDLYVDMSLFNKIHVDEDILVAGGGINQGKIYQYLFDNNHTYHFAHGAKIGHPLFSHSVSRLLENSANELAFGGGSAGSVCISGLTSCGGVGSFRRTLGLAIDSVISYEIVVPPNKSCPKPTILCATSETNSDLFWALSGGSCANFGIITDITYKLPTIGRIVMYSISWPWIQAKEVLTLWLNTSPLRPSAYNEDISMFSYPGSLGIELGGLYVIPGDQTDEQAVQTVEAEMAIYGCTLKTRIVTYPEAVESLSSGRVYYPFSATQIYFSSNIVDVDFVIGMMDAAQKINGLCLFGIELLGGKISEVPPSGTAFYPRNANFFYDLFAYCASSLDVGDITAWVKTTFDVIYNPKTDNVFVAFPIPKLENHLDAYYGKNKNRLIGIKHKYDTYGVMNYPQGINI